MKPVLGTLFFLLAATASVHAEVFQYDARSDFESLDEGAAPYYIDNPRAALAINAANESFREVFARASTTFSEPSGKYNVTISALGEIDGECEYRFLVDGVVVGTATNQPTAVDYEVQQHIFNGITIPTGAVISVESNALTNSLIPEGSGTAFARGRWQSLTLETVPAADTVADLSIAASVSTETPAIGEQYTVALTVSNNSSNEIATNPTVVIPDVNNTTILADGSCAEEPGGIRCTLPELTATQSTTVNLLATTSIEGSVSFAATVSADQSDDVADNNTISADVNVVTPTPNSVDLALSVSSNVEVVNAGQTVEYMVTVRNQDQETTATSPVTGAALPLGLTFTASADCTATEQTINCALPELAPNQSASVAFTATAVQSGSVALVASVSANEPETTVSNNEVTHTITVVNDSSNNSQSEMENPTTGTGSSFPGMLLLLLLYVPLGLRKKVPKTHR